MLQAMLLLHAGVAYWFVLMQNDPILTKYSLDHATDPMIAINVPKLTIRNKIEMPIICEIVGVEDKTNPLLPSRWCRRQNQSFITK